MTAPAKRRGHRTPSAPDDTTSRPKLRSGPIIDPKLREATEKQFIKEARTYYKALARWRAAVAAAASPAPDEPGKYLMRRDRMVEITKEFDPWGEGLTIYEIRKIANRMGVE